MIVNRKYKRITWDIIRRLADATGVDPVLIAEGTRQEIKIALGLV